MINKLKIVEEEVDEAAYWLELLQEAGLSKSVTVDALAKEAEELRKIMTASIKTLRER